MWNPLRYSSWNKIILKKHTETKLTFDTAKTYQKRYPKDHVEGASIFHSLKLYSKKWIKTTSIFGQSKSGRKRYIEMRSIFFPSKLGWEMYVETISKFRPFRLRCTKNVVKITSKKVRGNDVDFLSIETSSVDILLLTFRCKINISSTSIPHVVSVGRVS